MPAVLRTVLIGGRYLRLPFWVCPGCNVQQPRERRKEDVLVQMKLPGLQPGRRAVQTPCAPEDVEQQRLFEQISRYERDHWQLTTLFHIPNERWNALECKLLSRQGVRAGVPDLLSPVPSHGYFGLAIELKRLRGGRVEQTQREWLDLLRWLGWRVAVCKGWQAAWTEICDYFDLEELI